MRKFYSLFAVVILAASVNAQGAETFETQTVLDAGYLNGSFGGETSGVTVNYVHSRDQDAFAITGKGLMLRRSDEPSSVEFVIPNGVGTFTFKYRKAFTGGANNRVLAVFVNGVEKNVIAAFGGAGADATVYTSTTAVNESGPVSIRISYPAGTQTGNKQITIDDVSWTANATAAVVDVNASKVNLVKNSVVGNTIIFAAKADVQIVNMNGQVVKTASVNENTSLEVASLAKGMYVVTATVNGKAVSQKIIKK